MNIKGDEKIVEGTFIQGLILGVMLTLLAVILYVEYGN
jgi:hypothetical protein